MDTKELLLLFFSTNPYARESFLGMHPRWHIPEHTNRSLLQKVQVTCQMVGYHAPKPALTEGQDAGLGPSSLALNASAFLQYVNRCTDRKKISSYTKSLLFLYVTLVSCLPMI